MNKDPLSEMTEEELEATSRKEDAIQKVRRKIIFNNMKNMAIGVGAGLVVGLAIAIALASGRDTEDEDVETEDVLVEEYE